nr:MazG family protein [Agromyces seonyuensis]
MAEVVRTVAVLRGPGGCPWDGEQTHASLVRYLVEECFELVEAIESGDPEAMLEELGDVLYQVLFHADLASATPGAGFDVDDVARRLNAKLVSRHPHVFGDREASSAEEVVAFWDDLKAAEKPHRTSILDGVPMGMPALALADKVLGKAAKADVHVEPAAVPATEEALGAELLALVSGAREAGLDPERALRAAIRGVTEAVRAAEGATPPVE